MVAVMWLLIFVLSKVLCISLQSIPVQPEGHAHKPGKKQFPPLKQPAGHTAVQVMNMKMVNTRHKTIKIVKYRA